MPATPQPPASAPPLASNAAHASRPGPWIITALVVLLLILHQDNWFWTDGHLVFGFMPIGLLWHACISIAAAFTWFLSTKIAWPIEPELDAAIAAEADSHNQADAGEVVK